MFGLDEWISGFSDSASIGLVLLVSILLGLRHASDPDHVAAVTTLIVGGKQRAARAAARLGLAWGLGHGTSLFVFGLPIVLFNAFLPEPVQQAAETLIGFVIIALAVRLLVRWHRGSLHLHGHAHGRTQHVHLHGHADTAGHAHHHKPRTVFSAFGIGVVHGMGGSAGVSILILASIHDKWVAVLSLGILAAGTALSMTIMTAGFGLTLGSPPVRRMFGRVAPALGVASVAFGVWYATAAWNLVAYPF